jgi:equilibrative nucleoside transporter 1/2/3
VFLVFFAITMMAVTLALGARRKQPAYAAHLKMALVGYVAVGTLLMLSTIGAFNVAAGLYFPFTVAMVIVTAIANGLSQNSAFAFAAGFGRTEYAPAIMTGEALAALLPSTIGQRTTLILNAYTKLMQKFCQLSYFHQHILMSTPRLQLVLRCWPWHIFYRQY